MTYSDRKGLIRTLSSFVFLICMLSLAGWCCIPERKPEPLRIGYDPITTKETLVRIQPHVMAEQTAKINEEMARRSRK